MANKTKIEVKQDLITEKYIGVVLDYITRAKLPLHQTMDKLCTRPSNVRLAKLANFEVSGVKLSALFSDEELYTITNKVYARFRDMSAPNITSIKDDELLKQLKAK